MDKTEPPSPADRGSGSNDLLGLLPIGPHDHPDPHTMVWSDSELRAIKAYAARCVAALALWPRDCRLCANFRDGLVHAAHCVSPLRCEDSSAYRATQPVQFWQKRLAPTCKKR